jgi:hypothetical protein
MENGPRETRTPGDYFSYLLRIWREGARWRASLHDPHTGERVGFATLDDLVKYLYHQVDTSASTDENEMIEGR